MNELTPLDLRFVLSRLPKDIRELMQEKSLVLAGGFIRATIAGEKPSDIDLFGSTAELLENCANKLCADRKGHVYKTDNAFTVLSARLPVQLISRWLFPTPDDVIESFDFTVCQASIWWALDYNDPKTGKWVSRVSENFYSDLAARRLVYTRPARNEDAGGSVLRVRKYLGRGYNIQAESLGRVIARLVSKLDFEKLRSADEDFVGQVLVGLLREVDPLALIDGIEPVNEHEVNQ